MRSHSPKGALSPVLQWLLPVLVGSAIGLIAAAVILMGFALLLSMQDIPLGAVLPMSLAAMAAGAFLGGWLGARLSGRKGLLYGLGSGVLYCLAWIVVSLAITRFPPDASLALKAAAALVCSCVGGILGVNQKGRRKA